MQQRAVGRVDEAAPWIVTAASPVAWRIASSADLCGPVSAV